MSSKWYLIVAVLSLCFLGADCDESSTSSYPHVEGILVKVTPIGATDNRSPCLFEFDDGRIVRLNFYTSKYNEVRLNRVNRFYYDTWCDIMKVEIIEGEISQFDY